MPESFLYKRVFEVFDFAAVIRSDVEPNGNLFPQRHAKILRDGAVSPLFFARDRLARKPERVRFARFNFHKRVHTPAERDNIRFAEGRFIVTF